MCNSVVVPCCGHSFCLECITTYLIESDDHMCPMCNQTDVYPVDLIPNKCLRQAIIKLRNGNRDIKCLQKQPQTPKLAVQGSVASPSRPTGSRQRGNLTISLASAPIHSAGSAALSLRHIQLVSRMAKLSLRPSSDIPTMDKPEGFSKEISQDPVSHLIEQDENKSGQNSLPNVHDSYFSDPSSDKFLKGLEITMDQLEKEKKNIQITLHHIVDLGSQGLKVFTLKTRPHSVRSNSDHKILIKMPEEKIHLLQSQITQSTKILSRVKAVCETNALEISYGRQKIFQFRLT